MSTGEDSKVVADNKAVATNGDLQDKTETLHQHPDKKEESEKKGDTEDEEKEEKKKSTIKEKIIKKLSTSFLKRKGSHDEDATVEDVEGKKDAGVEGGEQLEGEEVGEDAEAKVVDAKEIVVKSEEEKKAEVVVEEGKKEKKDNGKAKAAESVEKDRKKSK
jgi:hypothetical protein